MLAAMALGADGVQVGSRFARRWNHQPMIILRKRY
jgi:hypothetical protein